MCNSTRISTASCWHEQYWFKCSASLQPPYFTVYSVLLTHNIVLGQNLLTIDYFWRCTLQNSASTHWNYIVQQTSVQSTHHGYLKGFTGDQRLSYQFLLGLAVLPTSIQPLGHQSHTRSWVILSTLGKPSSIPHPNDKWNKMYLRFTTSLRRRQLNGCCHWLKSIEIYNMPVHQGRGATRSLIDAGWLTLADGMDSQAWQNKVIDLSERLRKCNLGMKVLRMEYRAFNFHYRWLINPNSSQGSP